MRRARAGSAYAVSCSLSQCSPAETRRAAIVTARPEHNHCEAGGDPGVCLSNSRHRPDPRSHSDENWQMPMYRGGTDGWEERRFRIWPLRITELMIARGECAGIYRLAADVG